MAISGKPFIFYAPIGFIMVKVSNGQHYFNSRLCRITACRFYWEVFVNFQKLTRRIVIYPGIGILKNFFPVQDATKNKGTIFNAAFFAACLF